jgi:hypothetical protein
MGFTSGPSEKTSFFEPSMFTNIEDKVVSILKGTLPNDLVPAEQIVAGPVGDPTQVPFVAFTAGNFDIIADDEILAIPKPDDMLTFVISSHLEVWAGTLEKVEEIALKAMGAILANTPTIEAESNGELTVGNLKLSFSSHRLRPLKGVKVRDSGNTPKGEVTYVIESVMTVSKLDFDFGKMEVIDAVMDAPRQANFQVTAIQPVLEKDVGAILGIGSVTREKLLQNEIFAIRQLALADKHALENAIPNIDVLIEKAKSVRRITNEILLEIVDRSHPFPEVFFEIPLTEISQMSAESIQSQTGKNEEKVFIFLENVHELGESLLKAAEFAELTLHDFK